MNDLQKVALRQNRIYLPKAEFTFSKFNGETLRLIDTLYQHGFAVTQPLLYALNNSSTEIKKQITNTIEDVLGTKLNWTPLIKNWEVPIEDSIHNHLITAKINNDIQCFHREKNSLKNAVYEDDIYRIVKLSCGHYIPEDIFPLHRYNGCPFCGTPFIFEKLTLKNQGSKQKILDVWTIVDAIYYLENLLTSKVPLDATQTDSLKILLQHFLPQNDLTIGMKETLILVIDDLISKGKESECIRFLKGPTDILRYLWYKKTGFLQIIEPKTIIKKASENNRHINRFWDTSIYAKIITKENLKLKYTRKECIMVAHWLNNLPLPTEKIAEQMHPKRGMWIRFIRALRLSEYSKRQGFENLRELLDVFYNKTYVVSEGRINYFRLKFDAEGTFNLLKKRPGLFARSLFANMLWFGSKTTIEAFKEVINQVPMRLLFTLSSYAELYFDANATRSVRTITGIRTNISANQFVSMYSQDELNQMQDEVKSLCLYALNERFKKEETDFHRVYIDPILDEIPLPIGDRSQNIQDFEPTLMGETILLEGNKIRLFMQWGKDLPAQHLDMDLSAHIAFEKNVTMCYFGNLNSIGCKHSGDIRSIPNKIGTAEYIEIEIDTLRKAKAKYVTFTCNAYSVGGIPPNLIVGWMDCKHKMKVSEKNGVAYDPSCVTKQIRISQPLLKGLVFGVLDVNQNKIIWLEMPFSGQTVHDLDSQTIEALIKKVKTKISIGNVLKIKADSKSWEIAKEPNSADTIYDLSWAKKQENINSLFID